MKKEESKNEKGEVVYRIEHRDDCPTLKRHPSGTPHWGCSCPGTERIHQNIKRILAGRPKLPVL